MSHKIFDTTSRAQKIARTLSLSDPAMFLHERAATQILERLDEVNRTFRKTAIITPFPDFWGARFKNATLHDENDVLDLGENSLDLVIHALSLHAANDPVGQMIQCKNALKPDGLFIGVLFGQQTLSELRAALATAESQLVNGISPRVAAMADIRDLGALLQRAGLALPVADIDNCRVTYGSLKTLMLDLRAMGETNTLTQRARGFTPRHLFDLAENIYRQNFSDDVDRLIATFDMVYLTGWKPHESQQQPLRPGSAKARLAEALKTPERSAGEVANEPNRRSE